MAKITLQETLYYTSDGAGVIGEDDGRRSPDAKLFGNRGDRIDWDVAERYGLTPPDPPADVMAAIREERETTDQDRDESVEPSSDEEVDGE